MCSGLVFVPLDCLLFDGLYLLFGLRLGILSGLLSLILGFLYCLIRLCLAILSGLLGLLNRSLLGLCSGLCCGHLGLFSHTSISFVYCALGIRLAI